MEADWLLRPPTTEYQNKEEELHGERIELRAVRMLSRQLLFLLSPFELPSIRAQRDTSRFPLRCGASDKEQRKMQHNTFHQWKAAKFDSKLKCNFSSSAAVRDMDWNWVDSKMSIRIIKQLLTENGWSGILLTFYLSKIVSKLLQYKQTEDNDIS